ncbi:hypothetical protein BOX15_Mlig001375g2, partial [Macrostomum lignano]
NAMAKLAANESLESQSKSKTSANLTNAWREHMQSRSFTTEPHHLHRLGILAYFYCLLATPALFLTRVLPQLSPADSGWWAAGLATAFLVAENFLNYRACIIGHHEHNVVHCFHCQRTSPAVLAWQAGGDRHQRCLACQTESPPRSEHCRLCNLCVMRRHFHCYLLCCCIGHRTHGHFLALCLYSTVGLATSSLAFAIYAFDVGGGWSGLLLPAAALRFAAGSAPAALPAAVFSLYIQLTCLAIAAIYGFLQLQLLLRNQTPAEIAAMDRRYRLDSCYDNLRASLGPARYWPLLLLYPIRIEPDSDGCNWRLRSKRS